MGALAAQLHAEVEADRGVLDALARRVDEGSSLLKDATGWLGAKISQLKLGRQTAGTLGTFQALETLALGVLGKLALWRALMEVAPSDARLSGVDFCPLVVSAEVRRLPSGCVQDRREGTPPLSQRQRFQLRYPAVVLGLTKLPNETVIDGELIALADDGRPSFNAPQNYGSSGASILYFVFDVMIFEGHDVKKS